MRDNSITVIIPCYNGWKYFRKCLESLENQTIKPDQVVIVDDCSTDETYEKLLDYKIQSSLNILIIKNVENCGPSISRKKGIENSTSSYICFCDCDDWYETNFIEIMKKTISEKSSDLIIFDNYKIINDKKIKANVTASFINSDSKEILALYPMSLCRTVTSNDLIKKIYFPPLYNGEDGAVVSQIIQKAKHIVVLNDAFYNYYYRYNSASMKPSKNAYLGMIKAFEVIENYINSSIFNDEIEFLGIKFVCIAATLSGFKAKIDYKNIKQIVKQFEKKYPNWTKNKYFKKIPRSKRLYLIALKRNHMLICNLIANIHTMINKV